MLTLLGACAPSELEWEFRLDPGELRADTRFVIAEVRRGDCEEGEALYCEAFRLEPNGMSMRPVADRPAIDSGPLGEGEYCLVGFALNADAVVVGRSWATSTSGSKPNIWRFPEEATPPPIRISPAGSQAGLVSGEPNCRNDNE